MSTDRSMDKTHYDRYPLDDLPPPSYNASQEAQPNARRDAVSDYYPSNSTNPGRAGDMGVDPRMQPQRTEPSYPYDDQPRRRSERIESNRQMETGRADTGPRVMGGGRGPMGSGGTGGMGAGNGIGGSGIGGRFMGRMTSRYNAVTGGSGNSNGYGERGMSRRGDGYDSDEAYERSSAGRSRGGLLRGGGLLGGGRRSGGGLLGGSSGGPTSRIRERRCARREGRFGR